MEEAEKATGKRAVDLFQSRQFGLLTPETMLSSNLREWRRGEIALLDISNMGSLKRRLEFLSYLLNNRIERVN
jgi:hypothetical protein